MVVVRIFCALNLIKGRKKVTYWHNLVCESFFLFFYLLAYLRVLYVSSYVNDDGEMFAIMTVRQFPPRLSFNMRVMFESRYGICFEPSANLLMQLPSANNDLLILAPSLNRCPTHFVLEPRSLPAKSIIDSFTIRFWLEVLFVIRMCTWNIAWLRLLSIFRNRMI